MTRGKVGTKKGRSRDALTSDRVDQIIGLIDIWRPEWGKLTGDHLAARIKLNLGFDTTRPALLNGRHEGIRKAYDTKIEALYGPKKPPAPKPLEDQLREQRVDRLVKENAELRAENIALKQQFFIWIGNARRKGLSEADLNAPLPQARADRPETAG